MRLSHIKALNSPGAVNYKVYADQFVPVGTKNFLFYAKAIDVDAEQPITTMDEKFRYGVLNVSGLTNEEFNTPNDITVSLEQINTSVEAQAGNAVGRNIVILLNNLANTTVSGVAAPNDKWSTATNATLAHLYKNFLGTTVSSSRSVSFILSKLFFGMERVQSTDPSRPLADAICQKILDACNSAPISGEPVDLKSDYAGYPGNIGLPDGAVRVRWNSSGLSSNSFTDVTANYGKNMRTEITDYVYPAALWYHISTPLKASNDIESPEYDLAGRRQLRRDHINRAVGIVGKDACLGQFLGQIGADDLCAVHADDGIDRCIRGIAHGQNRSQSVRFVAACLQRGDLHIISHVGMRGDKVSWNDLQLNIRIALSRNFGISSYHYTSLPFL